MVQSGLPEEWWDGADGMLLLLSERARQNGHWQDSLREIMWCQM